jgi:hypothetical protein
MYLALRPVKGVRNKHRARRWLRPGSPSRDVSAFLDFRDPEKRKSQSETLDRIVSCSLESETQKSTVLDARALFSFLRALYGVPGRAAPVAELIALAVFSSRVTMSPVDAASANHGVGWRRSARKNSSRGNGYGHATRGMAG